MKNFVSNDPQVMSREYEIMISHETRIPGENHQPVASWNGSTDILYCTFSGGGSDIVTLNIKLYRKTKINLDKNI
jgi:hypothetical protein